MSKIENNNPMTSEEVSRLRTVKAKSTEKPAAVEKLFSQAPAMETINGRTFPKGMKAIGMPMDEKQPKTDLLKRITFTLPMLILNTAQN